MPRLAISPEFPRELGALASPVRRDVIVAVRRFLANAAAAPYPERVRGARDPRLVTLRLADHHRGVSVRQGDVHWLLTVLPDAQAWSFARRHRCTVNSVIGVVELWDAEALERVRPALHRAARADGTRIFAHICDADLLALGIDPRLLPLLRLMTQETHLTAIEPLLPHTQYAPLAVLARGGTLSDAWWELADCQAVATDGPPPPVNTDDLAAALERTPDRAALARDPKELDRILAAPDWCTFLHPPQYRLSHRSHYEKPVLVIGGAGTGKTLIALHRAAYLARQATGPVLLVTFSQSLAADLSSRLDVMIDDEVVRKRIEVGNVDRLAHRIVTEAEGRPPTLVSAAELVPLWEEAARETGCPYGPAFLLREWEQVVLAQNLRTLEEYLAADRPGRGVELDAQARTTVWRCIDHVVQRLRASGRRTLLQLAADAAALLSRTTGDLLADGGPRREPYRHIVVDEAQDLHPAQWRLLRAAVPPAPNDLFIVGDPHQRIFDTRVSLADLGIPVRTHRLKVSYRLSPELLAWGIRVRGGGPADGLVDGATQLYGLRGVGEGRRPEVRQYVSVEAELAGLVARLREWLDEGVPPDRIGVAARETDLVRAARRALREADIPVRVTTMHGMKGLEFRRVAVIGVAEGVVPSPAALTPATEDVTARAHDLQRERGLLYMACTRASELLYVSYSGRASPFLPP